MEDLADIFLPPRQQGILGDLKKSVKIEECLSSTAKLLWVSFEGLFEYQKAFSKIQTSQTVKKLSNLFVKICIFINIINGINLIIHPFHIMSSHLKNLKSARVGLQNLCFYLVKVFWLWKK